MFKKTAAKAIPKPNKCDGCGHVDFDYVGHTDESSDVRGYVWKCKKCGQTQIVPKKP